MSLAADVPASCDPLPITARGSPEDRSREARSRELLWCRLAAAAVLIAFVVYFGSFCFLRTWVSDFQTYSAALSRLYENLAHPTHETIAAPGVQSFTYTPYLLLVAAFGKLASLTPYRAFQIAGVVNVILYVLGAAALFRQQSMHQRWEIPLCCFLYATLCLRWQNFGWSSETTLINLQYTQAYPSTLGWALAFFAFALVKPATESRSLPALAGLSAIIGLLLVTHGLTGSWVVGIVGVYALYTAIITKSHVPLTRVLLALVVAVALGTLWPYPPILGPGSFTTLEHSKFGQSPLRDVKNLYWVALPSALYLYGRLRKHEVWVFGFIATLGALWLWRKLGIEYGNRYTFFAAFFGQFAVGEAMAFGVFALARPLTELPATRELPVLDRPVAVLLVAAALVAWIPSPMYREHRAELVPHFQSAGPSPHDAYYARYADLRAHLERQDIVIMRKEHSIFDLAALSGAHFVFSPFLVRVPDEREREEDVLRFYDPATSESVRASIIERWAVTKIILRRPQFGLFEAFREQFGDALYQDRDWALFQASSN